MNPLFREYGLTTLSMAKISSYLEKKVTDEEIRPYPKTASGLSRSGGPLKGNKEL